MRPVNTGLPAGRLLRIISLITLIAFLPLGFGAAGYVRSAFFFSNGYYNVHPPIQNRRSLLTLKRIREEKGSFARFGIDLYRKYYEIVIATGAPSRPVVEGP